MLRTSLGAKHFNTRCKKQLGVALKNLSVTIADGVYLYSEASN
jgi:hypothetical protein